MDYPTIVKKTISYFYAATIVQAPVDRIAIISCSGYRRNSFGYFLEQLPLRMQGTGTPSSYRGAYPFGHQSDSVCI